MFIAMNLFRVTEAFETVGMERDNHLHQAPEFVEIHLLEGPERDDNTLYSTHVIWDRKRT
jgi:heme-degrading monooxygenase HmoA